MKAKDSVQQLEQIANEHLFIKTLETRHSDRLDFHDVSVWGVKAALQAAFEAGRATSANRRREHVRCNLDELGNARPLATD